MRRTWELVVAAVAVAALVVAGFALARDGSGWDHHPGARSMGSLMGSSTGQMMGGRWGSTLDEAGYLREMVAHHREAVQAAEELSRSERPAMRALGARIVESQSAQIDQMEGWLDEWYPDEDPDEAYEPMMRDLSGLSGDRLDRVFLEDMIGHHMVAVMMSQQLLVRDRADHEEVGRLARTIRADQMREIWWMRERLARWFDGGRAWGMGPGMHAGMGMGMGHGVLGGRP
jgi:uncharacterized protein (DUF305 family)